MNDNIKTNLDVKSRIKNVLKKDNSNVNIGNTINSSLYDEMDFSNLANDNLNVDEVLKIIPRNGEIDSDSIDYSRIATNSYDAIAGRFLDNIYVPWGENGTLTYEIRDNGSVLIRNNDVAMGYTDIYGISKIITNLEKENTSTKLNAPSKPLDYSKMEWSNNVINDKIDSSKLNAPSKPLDYSKMDWSNISDFKSQSNSNMADMVKNRLNQIHELEMNEHKKNLALITDISSDENSLFKKSTIISGDGTRTEYKKRVKYDNGEIIYYDEWDNVIKAIRADGSCELYNSSIDLRNIYSYEYDKIIFNNDGIIYQKRTLSDIGKIESYVTLKEINISEQFESYYYDNGTLKYKKYNDGSCEYYYESGTLKEIVKSDQTKMEYYENGQIKYEYDKNIKIEYSESGEISYLGIVVDKNAKFTSTWSIPKGDSDIVKKKDGSTYEVYSGDILLYNVTVDGIVTSYKYDNDNVLVSKIISDYMDEDSNDTIYYYNADGTYSVTVGSDVKLYYANGNLSKWTDVDGKQTYYYENGNIRSVYNVDDTMIEYYESGELKKIVNSDKSHTEYYENGQIKLSDNADGSYIYYYENGQISSLGKTDGSYISYREDGQITKIVYADGTTEENRYDENGILYMTEYADGSYKIFYENGNVSTDYNADGSYSNYYENGSLKYIKTVDGISYWYYENGQISEERHPDESSTKYNETGQVISIKNADGTYESYFYYDSGALMYANINGDYTKYDESGNIIYSNVK